MKRSMRWIILAVLAVLAAGASPLPAAAAARDGKPLRFATEGAYPPFNYVDDTGRLTGFDVDIGFALCGAMGVRCTIVAVPWDDLIPGLRAGDYDMVVASMARSPEREQVVDFSDSYYRSRTTFVAGEVLRAVPFPEGLRGKTVATQRNTVQGGYLNATYGATSHVVLTDDMEAAFDLLAAGKTDVVMADSLPAYEFLVSERGKGFDFYGEVLTTDATFTSAHITVRKGDAALRERINAALQTLRLNGEYDKINRKYFPFSIY